MASPNPRLICQYPRPYARLKLFCFPYAGGGTWVFRSWPEELDSDVAVYFVQPPGRENRLRQRAFESIEELIPGLTDGLARSIDRPFAFYGHSLGAKIAFEAIRELRRQGLSQPRHLFVGACQAPQLPWPHSLLHVLDESEFIEKIQQRYGGFPPQVLNDAELRSVLIPTLRADVSMMENYRYSPEPPLDCPITAFGGSSDRAVSRAALEAWRHQTRDVFRLHMVSGDHFFAKSRSLIALIAGELKASIAQGRETSSVTAGGFTG